MRRAVVVGGGAREHALALALARGGVDVTVTPGNAGMAAAGLRCVSTPAEELEADLYVIGPEVPLVDGLADRLRAVGRRVFGPGADGAQLEGSKVFLKEFLEAAQVATARFATFDDVAAAEAYLEAQPGPYVIKTDGLAAGKGVLVTSSLEDARRDVRDKLSGAAFGAAGTRVVIEEFLDGVECSLLVLCDGHRAVPLIPAQDYKRVGDNDEGPNTGGMGARAPLASVGEDDVRAIMDLIVTPTVKELRARGIDFRGVLYAGVMMTATGPKLLEYNVRFGDPEAQVVVPLLADDLYDLLAAVADGGLNAAPRFQDAAAVTVVLAAEGYPESPRTGAPIAGLAADGQSLLRDDDVTIYHAGTARDDDGTFRTAGGRVLAVTALGPDEASARDRAYRVADTITFPGQVRRRDIAARR